MPGTVAFSCVHLPSAPFVATKIWPSLAATPLRPVAEDVLAGPRRMGAAVDIAAGDRNSQASLGDRGAVVVDHDRVGQPVLVARRWVGVRVDVVEAFVANVPASATTDPGTAPTK